MPALKPTKFSARVTWLGVVEDRDASLQAAPKPQVMLLFGGVAGEAHGGLTRPSCSRVLAQHPRNTPIANVRQLSVLSAEDLHVIADRMGLPALQPEWLGASMMVEGLPDFTHLPPSARLQAPSGATLVVDMENRPCTLPARPIEAQHPGFGAAFKAAAKGRRGVTMWVEREGAVTLGDTLRLHIPDQPVWAHLGAARRG